MSDVRALYQEAILEHSRNPRHAALPDESEGAAHRAEGHNPLCGDKVTIGLRLDGDGAAAIIRELGFNGVGCAISIAAASMMADALQGASIAEAHDLARRFHAMVASAASKKWPAGTVNAGAGADPDSPSDPTSLPEPLGAFAEVANYPMRRKCATLCWETLESALER